MIANRGEIAWRIMRTAREIGSSTVAVYADGDVDAPFARFADQAISLDGSTSAETYLSIEKVLAAADRSGADAVHPGYGFLSENADFARAVVASGRTWIGPSSETIEAMGDKLEAKRLMAAANVPVLESAELGGAEAIEDLAERVGYPLLIKAAAGGGGRGMRTVHNRDELADAVAGGRSEAKNAFGNETVFIEKYVAAARHIEIQILGDQHGSLVHCFERECSIQRRYQKVVEEAPSSILTDSQRNELCQVAIAAAQAIGYYSAGTVEFLFDAASGNFYFLEINTRLQVEHPVTEAIIGLDLVREQIRVARGERLGYDQDAIVRSGHAVEARIYAEDPDNNYRPGSGTLAAWSPPATPNVRLDAGVKTGSTIGPEFDPMLAKAIAHAPTREEAASKLALWLEQLVVAGVRTNRDQLVGILRSPQFGVGDTTTDFLERVQVAKQPVDEHQLQRAVAAIMATKALDASDKVPPLSFLPRWFRNSSMPPSMTRFLLGAESNEAGNGGSTGTAEHGEPDAPSVRCWIRSNRADGFDLAIEMSRSISDPEPTANTEAADLASRSIATNYPGDDVVWRRVLTNSSTASHGSSTVRLTVDGATATMTVVFLLGDAEQRWHVHGPGGSVELVEVPLFPRKNADVVAGGQLAPMPGSVGRISVSVGDEVAKGDSLAVVEAMKMEHVVVASTDGIVTDIRCGVGEQVENGQIMIVIGDPERSA